MELKIHENIKTSELQDAFAKAFYGLKIVFVKNEHGEGEGSRPEDMITTNQSVHIANGKKETSFHITKDVTIGEVEAMFHDELNLNVQVFRKAGGVWIETVNTDHWTIEQQLDAVR